jgi:hypothetical protein
MCVEYRTASFRDDILDAEPGCNFLEFSILFYHYEVMFKGKTDRRRKTLGIMRNKERSRILSFLTMVYNTRNHWDFVLWPSGRRIKSRKPRFWRNIIIYRVYTLSGSVRVMTAGACGPDGREQCLRSLGAEFYLNLLLRRLRMWQNNSEIRQVARIWNGWAVFEQWRMSAVGTALHLSYDYRCV